MAIIVKSPYTDDETRTKGIEKLLEDFISDNWNIDGVPLTDVKIGQKGTQILQGGKPITLRAYTYSSLPIRLDISGQRWSHRDAVMIDVYVLNNDIKFSGREPRGLKILTFLKDLFMINQGKMSKGISQVDLISGDIEADIHKENLTHVMVRVIVTYVWDVLNE